MTRRRRIVVAVLTLFAGAIVWLFLPPSETPFYDYLAERRAAGLATSFDEFLGPMPPDSENGAADLDAAVKAVIADYGPTTSWKNSPYDANMLSPGPDGLTPEQTAILGVTVTRMRPWTERRDAVLAKPRLRVHLTLDGWGELVATHVTTLQNAQRILSMQAQAEDEPARRLAGCRAELLLGHRIEPETLFESMVGASVTAGAVASLRRAVESGFVDATPARAACDDLLRESKIPGMRRGLHAFAVQILEQYRAFVEGRAVARSAGRTWWARAERRVEKIVTRMRGKSAFPELEPGMAATVVALCRGTDAVADGDVKLLVATDAVDRLDPAGALKPSGFDGLVTKLMRSAVRCDAQTRLARVALAVAEYRKRHGDFPASLADLREAFPEGVPLDPFTDAPFVYVQTTAGVRIEAAEPRAGPIDSDDTPRDRGFVWQLKR